MKLMKTILRAAVGAPLGIPPILLAQLFPKDSKIGLALVGAGFWVMGLGVNAQ